MKRICFLLLVLMSFSTYANNKGIPSPILYRLSKAILTETQNLFSTPKTTKQKVVKTGKTPPCTLKCLPKKEKQILPVSFTKKPKPSSEVWTDSE